VTVDPRHMAKALDFDYAVRLLELVAAADIPEFMENGDSGDVEFQINEAGWKVVIFYDCGDWDYISEFIDIYGNRYDPWEGDLNHSFNSCIKGWNPAMSVDEVRERGDIWA